MSRKREVAVPDSLCAFLQFVVNILLLIMFIVYRSGFTAADMKALSCWQFFKFRM